MSHGERVEQELKPSEKSITEDGCGPAKVPAVSNTSGVHFPNLNEIISKSSAMTPRGSGDKSVNRPRDAATKRPHV